MEPSLEREGAGGRLKPLLMKKGLGLMENGKAFALHNEGRLDGWRVAGRSPAQNLRAANRQPSTNTKTKLDLTKARQDFHKPLNAVANLRKLSEYRKIF